MSALKSIFVAVPTLFLIGRGVKKFYDNLWHNMKIDVPFDTISAQFQGIQYLIISFSLDIENHFDKVFELSKVHSTVFVNGKDGNLIEIGSTPPNARKLVISGNKKTRVNLSVRVGVLTIITQIKSLLKKPKGKRLLVRTSCYINGLPFQTETWY